MAIRDSHHPPVSRDQHDQRPVKARRILLLPALALLLSVLCIILAWWVATRPTPKPGPIPMPLSVSQPPLTKAQLQAFFDREVRPQLDQYAQRNHEAVRRAEDHMTSQMDAYQKHIPAFVEDITSWGTRFGVIGRSSQDWWERWWGEQTQATRVRAYVSAKFEKSLFSDRELADLIEETLQQFLDDLQASQNRLYAEVKAAWKRQSNTPDDLDLQQIVAQVDEHVSTVSQQMAIDSVMIGVLAEVGGNAFANATTHLVNGILGRVATSLATSAVTTTAASGGATGAGAVAGGTGGVALGPGGTVIGIAAGIVAGVVTDWWLTRKFEQKLTGECEQLLAQIQDQIWFGNRDAPGLKQAFMNAITTLQETKELALRRSLTEMTP